MNECNVENKQTLRLIKQLALKWRRRRLDVNCGCENVLSLVIPCFYCPIVVIQPVRKLRIIFSQRESLWKRAKKMQFAHEHPKITQNLVKVSVVLLYRVMQVKSRCRWRFWQWNKLHTLTSDCFLNCILLLFLFALPSLHIQTTINGRVCDWHWYCEIFLLKSVDATIKSSWKMSFSSFCCEKMRFLQDFSRTTRWKSWLKF